MLVLLWVCELGNMHSFSSLLVWYGVMMASELLLLQEQKGEVNGVVVCRVVVCVPLCFSVKKPKSWLDYYYYSHCCFLFAELSFRRVAIWKHHRKKQVKHTIWYILQLSTCKGNKMYFKSENIYERKNTRTLSLSFSLSTPELIFSCFAPISISLKKSITFSENNDWRERERVFLPAYFSVCLYVCVSGAAPALFCVVLLPPPLLLN